MRKGSLFEGDKQIHVASNLSRHLNTYVQKLYLLNTKNLKN